ncbi:MAG: hypothetical protein K0V04_19475, partial [Deltaproteobacteria bacterium]|nr:hypothetical protein [Deltaproteobacteria bacterium]
AAESGGTQLHLTAAQLGAIAAAAAHAAAVRSTQPRATQVAAAIAANVLPPIAPITSLHGGVLVAGRVRGTPMQESLRTGPAPHANLAAALNAAHAAATTGQVAGCQNLLDPLGDLIAAAHSRVSSDLTNVVSHVTRNGTIHMRAGRATQRVYDATVDATLVGPTTTALSTNASTANIRTALASPAHPTRAELGQAASISSYQRIRLAMGLSGQSAYAPSEVAWLLNGVLAAQSAGLSTTLMCMMAAGTAMTPSIPINPGQAALPALAGPVLADIRDSIKPAMVAAYVGATTVGAHFADVAKIAVLASRAAVSCAAGLPQPGCHRHPRQCGADVCSLVLNYSQ